MASADKKIDSVVYSYTADASDIAQENKLLRETVEQLNEEVLRLRQPALMICDVKEVFEKEAVIKVPNGNEFLVAISTECNALRPGDRALVEQKNLNIVKTIDTSRKFDVEKFVIMEQPSVAWKNVGGLEPQVNEIKEVVEMPLNNPKLFRKVGIEPPKGILLHGPPGTGKTLLAKAVASSTNSTFIEIVGSELVQKFIGEGAKLVGEIFDLAKKKAPSIIFIDEIDALAATRIEHGTSGEREVNRTFMQLLAELDGFDNLGDVKIIGATNRKDILDPAIVRPGRLDRLIHVPAPDKDGLKQIFKIHTSNMSLGKDIVMKQMLAELEGMTGAEVKAVCTEAGYFAIRDKRHKVWHKDFLQAIEKVRAKEAEEDFKHMFG